MTSARLWTWVLAILAIRLITAAILPVTTDEAYYAVWSSRLSWGYFDHPPMVALGGLLRELSGPLSYANPLMTRLPVVLFASTIIPAAIHAVARRVGAKEPALAVFLFCASLAGLASGLLLTPDAFLMAFWTASMLAAILLFDALTKEKNRELFLLAFVCGILFGLGMLAKYTFALMPMIFTWVLALNPTLRMVSWKKRATAFALTAITALLVFSPHLIWNARHDWVTFKFQLRHGFAGDHGEAPLEDAFDPPPFPSRLPYSHLDQRLASFFESYDRALEKKDATEKPRPPKRPKGKLEQAADWIGEYAGGQLAGFGLMLPFVIFALWRSRGKTVHTRHLKTSDPALAMTRFAAWVPFAFFGCFTPFSKVEANWPAMGFVGIAILAAMGSGLPSSSARFQSVRKWQISSGIGNALLLLFVAVFALSPQLRALFTSKPDRITDETNGFSALANHVASRWREFDSPLLVDKYQWTAMIKFHRPDAAVQQIRGITRDSEFTRAGKWQPMDAKSFRTLPSTSLLTSESRPPRLEGFAPDTIQILCILPNGTLIDLVSQESAGHDKQCQRALFLYSYKRW